MIVTRWKTPLLLGVITSPLFLAACSQTTHGLSVASLTDTVRSRPYNHTAKDKECLQRAMFFESNRSSRDGMIAVGTVVMNRLRSGKHGNTICQVVGERGQFAPGVMTRPMVAQATPRRSRAAPVTLMASAAPAAKAAPSKVTYVTAVASQPAKATPEKATPEKVTFVAMQEPDAARFGSTAGAQAVTSFPAEPAEPTMSFESTPENTDAIGAMIAGQGRPLETY
ncbi:cell wall hydrolase [Mesorhizobium sp.]|uniref:cell wall hydrolase n=1 Tax=Mesorhizobium sp. TaxID=1871066 RepID=UPI00257BEC41|nr:cell wall hydrolase [Mesorhizobium sp.]